MIFMGDDGPEGLYIDVLEHVAKIERWKIRYVYDSWENVFQRLKAGKIDILPVVAYTEARRPFLDYTRQTLLNNWGQVYTRDGLKINSIRDLEGKKIGIQPNDTHGNHFDNLLRQLNIEFEKVPVSDYLDIFKALDTGEIEAGVVNRIFGATHEENFSVKTTPIVFNPIEIRYAVPEGDPANLLPVLDSRLAELMENQDSVYHQSMARWFASSSDSYLPEWVRKILLGFICLTVIAMALIFWLRFEVRRKTFELKKSNENLKDSEEKFRQVTENIREVFWLGSIEWSELYYISPAFEEIWGKDIQSLYENHMAWFDSVFEEDKEKVRAAIKKSITSDTTMIDVPDYRIIKPDGAMAWISARAFPIFDSTGKPYRIAGIAEDITSRKNAEFKTQEISRLLMEVTEGTTDAIFVKDLDGRYLFANSTVCQTLGKKHEDIIEKTDNELFPEASAQVISEIDAKVIHTGKPLLSEEELQTLEGDTVWLSNKSPHFDDKGNITGIIGISRNITQLKITEREKEHLQHQLMQSQRIEAIGNLAGGIAHDFNNLLAPVLGISEMMMDDFPEGSFEYENAGEIFAAATRGKDLVKQILAFSRQSEDRLVPVKISETLKEALKLCRSTLPSYIEINHEIQDDCGFVMADSTQLHQIAMNLITNAYHAIEPESGKIFVKLAEIPLKPEELRELSLEPGRYAMLTVSDTGSGIDQEIIDRIFDPYFTTKDKDKGTGLGLSVAHGIVKEYQGDIRVYSDPGKGTTFDVYLPVMDQPVQEQPDKDQPDVIIQGGGEHIMVVDDEEPIVRLEKTMLERIGYKADAFTNSGKALAAFKESPDEFALVITDMTMPDMPGDYLAKELKAIRPEIPIIICTGFSERMNKEKARESGINAFLMKPVIMKDLARAIRTVLEET